MALSELPPAMDASGEPGAELPFLRVPPPGAMSRAWVARAATVDAPWNEARRERRGDLASVDFSPIVLKSALGANVEDLDGNRYVDLIAGFGSVLAGHGNKRIARALEMQSSRLAFGYGDVFPSDAKVALTERLARLLPEPGARVLLGLSGSDAIDAAIKTCLLSTGKPGILAFRGSYHGLATGPLAALGLNESFRAPFAAHLSTHMRFAPYPSSSETSSVSLSEVELELAKGDIGGVLVEPVLGRGGVVVPSDDFMPGLRNLCDRYGARLVCDEMWTGLGRSGALLYSARNGVIPDIVCLGKGLGGGLPMSACIGRGEVMESWRTPHASSRQIHGASISSVEDGPELLHGEAIYTSTHAGNPMGCASSIALLDTVIGTKLPDRAREEGNYLRERLTTLAQDTTLGIKDVRGVGLIVGIEVAGGAARGLALSRDLLSLGYLVLTGGAGDVLTLTPPLSIARTLLDGFVDALGDALAQRRH